MAVDTRCNGIMTSMSENGIQLMLEDIMIQPQVDEVSPMIESAYCLTCHDHGSYLV